MDVHLKCPATGRTGASVKYPGGSPFRFPNGTFRALVALLCAALLAPGELIILAQPVQQPAAAETVAKIPNEQLDALVAPIALYPDPLLAQVLAASTYPLEIVQLQQWLEEKNLKDKALVDAVKKQIGTRASKPWRRFQIW